MTDRDDALARFFFSLDEPVPDGLPLLEPEALDGAEGPGGFEAEAEESPLYLGVFVGAHRCALPIGVVREVAPVPPLTEVPRGPAALLGVGTVRGELVPIFDPARLLFPRGGAPPDFGRSDPSGDEAGNEAGGAGAASLARVVLTREPRLPALRVSRVEGVLQHGALEEASSELAGASQAIQGALRHRGNLWTVLATERLRP